MKLLSYIALGFGLMFSGASQDAPVNSIPNEQISEVVDVQESDAVEEVTPSEDQAVPEEPTVKPEEDKFNLKEFLDGIFETPEMTALLSTLIAFFTANLGTILITCIKLIKSKNKELKEKALSQEVVETLTKEYKAQVTELCDSIDKKLNELEKHVNGKLDEQEQIKREEIEKQSVQLENTIKEAKKSLNIDEILEQDK